MKPNAGRQQVFRDLDSVTALPRTFYNKYVADAVYEKDDAHDYL